MLNGVVLGGVGRIMGDANLDAQVRGQGLQVLLEDVITSAVAAPAIAQQQQGGGVRIVLSPVVGPPMMHRITGKFGGIAAGANLEKALILAQVIQAMGNRYPVRQRRPVMVKDGNCLGVVGMPWTKKRTNQFSFFVSILNTGLPAD